MAFCLRLWEATGTCGGVLSYILQRAREVGKEVYEKAKDIVKEGKARGSLTLKGFEKEVEVDGRKHVVKVIDGSAELDVGKSGKKLLKGLK